jgi:hypothetical protein
VYLATFAARDGKPAVDELEPLERIDEDVDGGRVHERDLGQIHHDWTGLVLEHRPQGFPEHRRRREIDFPLDGEHGSVRVVLAAGRNMHRQRIGPAPRAIALLVT